jgi:hypothetical protein
MGEVRSQIDRIYNRTVSGREAISNPLEVIERINNLLFLKRWMSRKRAEELKANREKKPMQPRSFSIEGKDSKKRPNRNSAGKLQTIRAACHVRHN